MRDGFDFEQIASLAPDLIIGTNAGMRERDYEKLSKIAPTIASPKDSPDTSRAGTGRWSSSPRRSASRRRARP